MQKQCTRTIERSKRYFHNNTGYGGLFYNDLIIHLGISYIATEQKEKACNTFRLIGDETNFRVRNYLKFFCL